MIQRGCKLCINDVSRSHFLTGTSVYPLFPLLKPPKGSIALSFPPNGRRKMVLRWPPPHMIGRRFGLKGLSHGAMRPGRATFPPCHSSMMFSYPDPQVADRPRAAPPTPVKATVTTLLSIRNETILPCPPLSTTLKLLHRRRPVVFLYGPPRILDDRLPVPTSVLLETSVFPQYILLCVGVGYWLVCAISCHLFSAPFRQSAWRSATPPRSFPICSRRFPSCKRHASGAPIRCGRSTQRLQGLAVSARFFRDAPFISSSLNPVISPSLPPAARLFFLTLLNEGPPFVPPHPAHFLFFFFPYVFAPRAVT